MCFFGSFGFVIKGDTLTMINLVIIGVVVFYLYVFCQKFAISLTLNFMIYDEVKVVL